jgi:hypothetical protein
MKRYLGSTLLVLALAACGGQPAPAAAVKPVAQPPAAAAVPAPVAAPVPVAAPAAAPAAKTPEAPKPDPDKELAGRVKQALEDEAKIQAAGIDVTASGGTVTLWGTTTSADERIRASRAAYRVQGVTTVDNKLAVVKGS